MQEIIERLRARGGRMTPQRRLILEALEGTSGHPTAEEVHVLARRRDPRLHLSTVYRTLRWLEAEGWVSSRWFQEERQERFDPATPSEHHHFVCTSCKSVIEFDDPLIPRVKSAFERRVGASVGVISVELYGLCPNCMPVDNDYQP